VELKVWSAIVVASIGYGTTGVATRAALNAGVPPIGLAAIRAVLAASVLAAWFLITRRPVSRDRHNLVTGLVSGLFQLSIPFILFTLAYQYASAGFVGLIVALMPLTVASVAHLFLPDEPLTGPKVIGLTVAFAGVGILLFSGDSGLGAGGRPLLAAVLTLGAVISMSFATVFIRSRAGTYDPVELTLLQFLVGVVVVGVAMFAAEGTRGDHGVGLDDDPLPDRGRQPAADRALLLAPLPRNQHQDRTGRLRHPPDRARRGRDLPQ
jgi:drug/metabolite transporter (DMT)-like permease